jgi:hypothetical protein
VQQSCVVFPSSLASVQKKEASLIENLDATTARLEKLAKNRNKVHPALYQMVLKYPTVPPYDKHLQSWIQGTSSMSNALAILNTKSVYAERAHKVCALWFDVLLSVIHFVSRCA